jgi:hypothetical protein
MIGQTGKRPGGMPEHLARDYEPKPCAGGLLKWIGLAWLIFG